MEGSAATRQRSPIPTSAPRDALRHLWMPFSRMGAHASRNVPVIVRGEGAYVWDQQGRRYLDGLSAMFVNQVGHGRAEIAEAYARQARELAFFPVWGYAHPRAIELSERLASLAPGGLDRVFYTGSGSESVEAAWKLARQYFQRIGQPTRYKAITRHLAYHGATLGALALTALPELQTPFLPLVPGAVHVPNTNHYRCEACRTLPFCTLHAADDLEAAIVREGPETVAAVFVEPVQNAGGCFPPPPGYFQRVREICDRHGVLLVSDEVICGFGRLGTLFGCERYGYVPDILTVAKGMSSGYAPIGAMIVSDRVFEPFRHGSSAFLHGQTFSAHPAAAAAVLANLDVIEREDLCGNVRENEAYFRASLERLRDLPLVGDVRGAGYFYGIELVKDRRTRETFTPDESERLLYGLLSGALFEAGLICRTDDRGDPVIQLAPPLVCGPREFDTIERILREVLTDVARRL